MASAVRGSPIARTSRSVDSATFNAHFDRIVAPAFTNLGGQQSGRRLFVNVDPWAIALLRTNLRNQPPPAFTLCVRHQQMRDFDDNVGGSLPTEPSQYPVKLAPGAIGDMFNATWRYQPMNLGRFPREEFPHTFSDEAALDALRSLRRLFDEALPRLGTEFMPTRLLCEIERHSEGAWCEQRWIEDLRRLYPDHRCGDDMTKHRRRTTARWRRTRGA